MTEERRQKLLQSSQGPGAEPFSQYNHMKVIAVDDGTATVELVLHPDSLNCWGTPTAACCSPWPTWRRGWPC